MCSLVSGVEGEVWIQLREINPQEMPASLLWETPTVLQFSFEKPAGCLPKDLALRKRVRRSALDCLSF
jgi:hypothetical protein